MTFLDPDECVVVDVSDENVVSALNDVALAIAELSSFGGPVDLTGVDLSYDE